MIFDKIDNYQLYPYGKAWTAAFEFLQKLTPLAEVKEYPIEGKDIFARVQEYNTLTEAEAKIEAHRHYVDIQVLLSGSESIRYFPASNLETKEKYDEKKDAAFFYPTAQYPVELHLKPGYFAVFFPNDAHMPQLVSTLVPSPVKKVVIKIAVDLLKK